MLRDPSRLLELLDIIGKKKFYMYVNKIPIGFKRTKKYLILFYIDPSLKGSPSDHVTLKINFNNAELLDIHRTIRTDDINKRIIVNMDYFKEPNGLRNLLIDLKNSEGSILQKIVIACMYYLLRLSYFEEGPNSSVNIPTKDEAIKLGLKYPCIVVETGLSSRIILAVMMKIARDMNRKQLWKHQAPQIPGYKTDFWETTRVYQAWARMK